VGKPEGKRLHGRPRHRWEDGMASCLKCSDKPLGSDAIELVS
jgi:hypothetical protein